MARFYGVLPAFVRRDKDLSYKQKVLYAELTAMADEKGIISVGSKGIQEAMGVTSTIVPDINALIDKGYIEEDSYNGKRKKNIYRIPFKMIVEEKPARKGKNFNDGLDEARKFTEALVSLWNSLYNTKYRPIQALISKVNGRLKSFTKDDIMDACNKRAQFMKNSAWHNKPENIRFKTDIYQLINSDDRLIKWLNLVPSGEVDGFNDLIPGNDVKSTFWE